jgi:hypothetical protein
MSRHINVNSINNVSTLFMNSIVNVELELQNAEIELTDCKRIVDNCKQKIKRKIYQNLEQI